MPEVTVDEKRAAETRLRTSATKQRVTQPAIRTAIALQRIVDGVYKTVKEAGDDLGLSARQRRELSEQVETTQMTRRLDQHFAKVQQEASSEQQKEVDSGKQASEPEAPAAEPRSDSREQAQLEAALAASLAASLSGGNQLAEPHAASLDSQEQAELEAALAASLESQEQAELEAMLAVSLSGCNQQAHPIRSEPTRSDRIGSDPIRSEQHSDSQESENSEEIRRRASEEKARKMAVRIRRNTQKEFDAAWQRQQMVRDMKRRMSHEEKRRKGERLLLHAIRMSTLNTRSAPPAWIFGCDGVEQGDTGAGVLLPSDQVRDLCACSVLTPWAWCWVCGGGGPIPMRQTLVGGELIRCQTCKTVRCTANCGCVLYNTPEVADDRFMLLSHENK